MDYREVTACLEAGRLLLFCLNEQAANTDDDKAKLKNFGCTHEQPPFRKIRGQEVTPGNGGQTAAVNW